MLFNTNFVKKIVVYVISNFFQLFESFKASSLIFCSSFIVHAST